MNLMRVAVLVLFAVVATRIHAESPKIYTWRSQDGRAIEGAFGGIDEDENTVTVLIPRAIPLASLHHYSQELARSIADREESSRAAAVATASEKSVVPPASPEILETKPKADAPEMAADAPVEPAASIAEDQFLPLPESGDCDLATWKTLTTRDKTNLIGSYVYAVTRLDDLSDRIEGVAKTASGFNALVVHSRNAMDELAQPNETASNKVSETFLLWVAMDKWFEAKEEKKSTPRSDRQNNLLADQSVKDIAFENMTELDADTGYPKIAGKVVNKAGKTILFGTFYFNWFDGEKIVAMESLLLSQLAPGEQQTFQIDAPGEAKSTDNANARMEITSRSVIFADE
ncbi:secreted protein [Rhodopirellula maiorica SM1]|uniref:Secreted protein n=1 Tax=Rhodopirellula maiorica SM1 TaxID=1265738 RepID=M5S3G5_9BACT|nr:secreted protein [Rhodopirellula maiorica SM1]